MKTCNYQEILNPNIDPNNTFIFCWNDFADTFFIIDENGNILTSDLGEHFIYFGS